MIVAAVMVVMGTAVIGLLLLTWALLCAVAGQEGEDDDAQEKYLADYENRRRLERAKRRKERKKKMFDFWLNLFYPRS